MAVPELWLLAGPNGAGKTTSAQRQPIAGLLPGVTFLNPDDRTLAKIRATGFAGFADAPADLQATLFIQSANEVLADLDVAIGRGAQIGVETVLSSDKYRAPVEAALAHGGSVWLLYVALSSPEIARQRVAARVRRGGHGVPDDKIVLRWQRSLNCLAWFAAHASGFWVVDNSDSSRDRPLPLLAWGSSGRVEFFDDAAFPEMRSALASLPVV
jgi:predicted ABC-type ATPase